MILADKIIRLRKRNGWSQEELADKMNVSRQAVSKWEGAQTIQKLKKMKLENPNILELGTGSGCISIALKKNIDCKVSAVDISEDAIQVARENATLNKVSIDFKVQDMLNINYEGYDLIISNPPYVSETEPVGKETQYEPQNALFAKEKGLFFYQEIIKKISELSTKPKLIAVEIGMTQGNVLLEFSKKHLSTMTSSIEKDLTGRDRYLFIERVGKNEKKLYNRVFSIFFINVRRSISRDKILCLGQRNSL